MSYTNKLDQNRSTVLINAGQQLLKPNSHKDQNFINSQISHNLLQQIDDQDQYQQIQNYQTQYIDKKGQTVDKSNSHLSKKVIVERESQNNQNSSKYQGDLESSQIISKQQMKSVKSNFHQKQQQKNDKNIKIQIDHEANQVKLSTLKQSNKKYRNSFEPKNFEKPKKQVKSKQFQPSYITNVHGLKQEDFYKVDYLKKQNKGKNNPYQSFNDRSIIKNDGLDQIQDIISQIQGLNKNSQLQINNPISKILPKNDLESSTMKYKKTKNMLNFPRQDKPKQKDHLSKLDDLLFNYRFDANPNNGQNQKDLLKSHKEEQVQNQSQFSKKEKQSERTKQKRQKKRIQSSFKPIQNQFHNKNEFDTLQEKKSLKQQNEKNNQKVKQKILQKNQDLNNLLQSVVILMAKWQELPIIPLNFNEVFVKLNSYPQHESFNEVISKINDEFNHYSIFNPSIKNVGLKIKDKLKESTKKQTLKAQDYLLLSEQQFAIQWEKSFQKSKLSKSLIQEQKQILMQFDVQWYQQIIKHCLEKDLDQITQNTDLTPYLTFLSNLHSTYKPENKLRKALIQNKLQYLNSYVQTKPQFQNKCVIIIIPNIISPKQNEKDTQQSTQILKEQLKNKHRGGIYFFSNSQNLCIISKNKETNYEVGQDYSQSERSIKIKDIIFLTLKQENEQMQNSSMKKRSQSDNKVKDKIEIIVKIDNQKKKNNLSLKCQNHTNYKVIEKQLNINEKTAFGQIYELNQLVVS